jgi:cyclic beta-1,2-glucan synthetase
MGSQHSEECRIDLLPQSFAVFADMPNRDRVETALRSAYDRLVDHRLRLVKLFDPPFQHSAQQPGYVKAYPSGLRENGGQYTHSGVWFAMALLEFGMTEEGWQVLAMLNPADRAAHPELARRYALEPYYMAADLYANPDAPGHGGWSLYTGAASWYYRAVTETLLGLKISGGILRVQPKLPRSWEKAAVTLTLRGGKISLQFLRGDAPKLLCDGKEAGFIPLDGKNHAAICYFV